MTTCSSGTVNKTFYLPDPTKFHLYNDAFFPDNVFDQGVQTHEVYKEIAYPIVDGAMKGFHGKYVGLHVVCICWYWAKLV